MTKPPLFFFSSLLRSLSKIMVLAFFIAVEACSIDVDQQKLPVGVSFADADPSETSTQAAYRCDGQSVVYESPDVQMSRTVKHCSFGCKNGACIEAVSIHAMNQSMALLTDQGSVFAWGRGATPFASSIEPHLLHAVESSLPLSKLQTSASRLCGVDLKKQLHCAGHAKDGSLGELWPHSHDGFSNKFQALPVFDVSDVAMLDHAICVLQKDNVFCWGELSPFFAKPMPYLSLDNLVLLDENIQALTYSANALCTVNKERTVRCYGNGVSNLRFPSPAAWVRVGEKQVCVRSMQGTLDCQWRAGITSEQLSKSVFAGVPMHSAWVKSDVVLADLQLGRTYACGISLDSDRQLLCVGSQSDGLQTISLFSSSALGKAPIQDPVSHVAVGDRVICAVAMGEVSCAGSNANGLWGDSLGIIHSFKRMSW